MAGKVRKANEGKKKKKTTLSKRKREDSEGKRARL